ncbi:MAG: TetR/AcrR family transcriptional regulator [Phenylobacterium sp.]|uniref:TetR/AcrR family transcriptional regulator n=1 Tax=Phenylobacterium sp. TaxID=1871053 RepID=UPI001210B907|nr:TetR/AcrR family transcriptional regulator [Phenylobacterium sp.]TAL32106.1 MAG: TetR/AcrR family transcriptional regulator [Phenylobacterium sp.]
MTIEKAESAGRTRTARTRRRDVEPKVSKQEQILAAAAQLFNAHGVGAVGLADLSKALGLSRATVYHYVADREDLVFRCYQRSCAAETEWLDRAEAAAPGLPRVLRYLEESLGEEAKRTAVITDIGLLSPGPREIITRDVRRNYERLAAMIGEGIRLGNIRPCDEQLIARVLPSMVAFYRVSGQWVEAERDIENVAAILDFVAWGSATDRDTPFALHQSADMFSPLQVRGLDALSVADLRIEQILMAGSKLINLRGAESLSLEDVVAALGVTRGTVYHYFNDREDLIRGCLERGYKLYEVFMDFAERNGRDGLEKSLIITHLNTQAQAGPLQPVAAWMGGEVLDPGLRATFADRLRKLLERSDAVAMEGIADGTRRRVDYRPLTIARAGAFLWIPKWIDQLDNSKPHRIADEIVGLFKSGLAV